MDPQYIGDGIYIQIDEEDPSRLIITTGSHKLGDADAVIYVELRELRTLRNYIHDFLERTS